MNDRSNTSGGIKKPQNIFISDLDKYVDKKNLDSEDTNRWKPIPYKTEEFSGVMLACGPGPNPVPITIRLHVEGLYSMGRIT